MTCYNITKSQNTILVVQNFASETFLYLKNTNSQTSATVSTAIPLRGSVGKIERAQPLSDQRVNRPSSIKSLRRAGNTSDHRIQILDSPFSGFYVPDEAEMTSDRFPGQRKHNLHTLNHRQN